MVVAAAPCQILYDMWRERLSGLQRTLHLYDSYMVTQALDVYSALLDLLERQGRLDEITHDIAGKQASWSAQRHDWRRAGGIDKC